MMIFVLKADPKIFVVLDETIKFYPFNYSNIFLLAFLLNKNLFIIKAL